MAVTELAATDWSVLLNSSIPPLTVEVARLRAMLLALAVIPVPPITLRVTAPVVPPPVKPVPAVTAVMSPPPALAST